MQRHGVGHTPDVTGDHRHGAEFAHGAGVAEDDAVEEAPPDVGHGHTPKRLPAGGPKRQGGVLLVVALRLHERDQLTRHEGKGDKDSREHDAGYGEDDADVLRIEPLAEPRVVARPEIGPEPALQAEDQHIDEPRDDGRNGKRQIDERDEQAFSAEVELRDAPRRRHAEHQVGRHRDGRRQQREPERAEHVRVGERGEKRPETLAQRLGEDRRQRQHEEAAHEQQR